MKMELLILIIHQVLFQGMFVFKNILLKKSLGHGIRGGNIEAKLSIIWFAIMIVGALATSYLSQEQSGEVLTSPLLLIGCLFLLMSLILSVLSLMHLGKSWRVGVIETQKTELVQTGIYSISRNPYFLSYILVFIGYSLILRTIPMIGGAVISILFIHWMITKEEKYLMESHGENYKKYMQKVSRYIFPF